MAKHWLMQAVLRNENGEIIGTQPPRTVPPERGQIMLMETRGLPDGWIVLDKNHETGSRDRNPSHGTKWDVYEKPEDMGTKPRAELNPGKRG